MEDNQQNYYQKNYQRGRRGDRRRGGAYKKYDQGKNYGYEKGEEPKYVPKKQEQVPEKAENTGKQFVPESPKQQETTPNRSSIPKPSGQLNIKAEPFKRPSGSKMNVENNKEEPDFQKLNLKGKPFKPKQPTSPVIAQPQIFPGIPGALYTPFGMSAGPAGVYQNIVLVQGTQPIPNAVFGMTPQYPTNYIMQIPQCKKVNINK